MCLVRGDCGIFHFVCSRNNIIYYYAAVVVKGMHTSNSVYQAPYPSGSEAVAGPGSASVMIFSSFNSVMLS